MLRAPSILALALLAGCATLAVADAARSPAPDAAAAGPRGPLSAPTTAPAATSIPALHAIPTPPPRAAATFAPAKPAPVITAQPLDPQALAAALELQRAKLAEQRPSGPSRAVAAPARLAGAVRPTPSPQVPGAIRAARRFVSTRLAAAREPSRAVLGGAPKPTPVVTRIPGTPLDAAQRAKLERARATQAATVRGPVSPVRDERK